MKKNIFFLFLLISFSSTLKSQNKTINWITFAQLEDSLKVKPKKVFISFFADWCSYCKKMDKVAFKNKQVISILNKKYYAIKMNVETKDTIYFGGKILINRQIGKNRKPTHEIPLLLASRERKPFSLPANIILNERFKIKKRYFEYLSTKKLLEILEH